MRIELAECFLNRQKKSLVNSTTDDQRKECVAKMVEHFYTSTIRSSYSVYVIKALKQLLIKDIRTMGRLNIVRAKRTSGFQQKYYGWS